MKLKLDIPNVDYIEIDNVDELMEILDKLNEKYELLRDNALKAIGMTSDEFSKANAEQKKQYIHSV